MSLKAFLEAEMRKAARYVGGPASAEAVHEARKAIKRLRAGLRLGRKAFGKEAAEAVNDPLRAAGRALGPVRDREVLAKTVRKLRAPGEPAPRRSGPRPSAARSLAEARRGLKRAASALRRLPWRKAAPGALADGLERLYRKGREAMREAQADPTDEALHAWRKRTKDLLYALPVAGTAVRELPREADRLAELLGDDHDLAFFAHSGEAKAKAAKPLRRRAGKRRRKLRKEAFREGKRLYGRRPKEVPRS